MTYGQDYGQPDQYPQQGPRQQWPQEQWPPQYQQPWAGPQGQPGQLWRPQPYDSGAHKRRLGQPREPYPPQGQPWPQQDYQPSQGPPPGWQPGYGQQPPWGPQYGYQPPQPQQRKPWIARNKVLTGVIAVGCLVTVSLVAKAAVSGTGKPAANTAAVMSSQAASRSPSAAAPDCATRARNWVNGGQLTTLGNDVSSFGTAAQALAGDMGNGADTAADTAALESAAATVESDAQAVEAYPGPSCIPGLRGDITAGARYYSAAAIDMTNALSQMSAGNMTVATADVDSTNAEMDKGNAKIAAATAAVKNFSASQGA